MCVSEVDKFTPVSPVREEEVRIKMRARLKKDNILINLFFFIHINVFINGLEYFDGDTSLLTF